MARSITPRPPRIQRGVISVGSGLSSATATISAVDTANTELRFLGYMPGTTAPVRLDLTNTTTVTATRTGEAAAATVSWELTEFFP